jgi:hypothetical protein
MARTIRRKTYVPSWVTEDWVSRYIHPVTGDVIHFYVRQLEGDERAAKLRWWHEDKSAYWGARPPTYYRKMYEEAHRAKARTELIRWAKNPEHPVQILRKAKLGYWD